MQVAQVDEKLAGDAVPPADEPAKEEERAPLTFLIAVTVVSLAADLVTKGWAKWRLSGFDPHLVGAKKIHVVRGYWDFIYALNPGGAWSFLRGLPESVRRPFFLFVSAAAIGFIVSIYRRVPKSHTAMKWGLPLALGGAMGNLVDRIRYGQVIDFIDMYAVWKGSEHHWPTYNVADIAIVIGVGLMAIDMIRSGRHGYPHPLVQPQVAGAPDVLVSEAEGQANADEGTESKVEEDWVELSVQEALELELEAAEQRKRESLPPDPPAEKAAEPAQSEERKEDAP